mmetsp:Transcript_41640/g.64977  ORF Transcript_41640/g.64977 Transcript_41640/m.64977 type:complete len:96 (+) Transcript_41640:1077-1364(+)
MLHGFVLKIGLLVFSAPLISLAACLKREKVERKPQSPERWSSATTGYHPTPFPLAAFTPPFSSVSANQAFASNFEAQGDRNPYQMPLANDTTMLF